jgi:hypothetical protein
MSRGKYSSIDGQKVSELLNFRAHNVTTAQRTTLAGTLSSTNKGLSVWDTDLSKPYWWDGSAFQTPAAVAGAMTFKGIVAFGAAEPSSPATGDTYIFSTAGTNTWNTSDVVQIGDSAIWNGTDWSFLQGNFLAASESVAGVIEIATQAETNTGTDDLRAVTPLKLATYATTKAFAKTYFNSSLTLVANTPLTVTHSLNLQNKNAFCVSLMNSADSAFDADIDAVDVNSFTITSGVAASSVKVTVIGF